MSDLYVSWLNYNIINKRKNEKSISAKEKLEIVQPACRQAGSKESLRFSKSFFLKAKYSLSPYR
jgi:hypothetical protein